MRFKAIIREIDDVIGFAVAFHNYNPFFSFLTEKHLKTLEDQIKRYHQDSSNLISGQARRQSKKLSVFGLTRRYKQII